MEPSEQELFAPSAVGTSVSLLGNGIEATIWLKC